MKPKTNPWSLGNLAMGGLIVALMGTFWWVLSRQTNRIVDVSGAVETAVATDVASQSLSGYPGPDASPSPPPSLPTATLLPDINVKLGHAAALISKAEFAFAPDGRPHFVQPATDGQTLVGVVVNSPQSTFSGYLVAVDLASGASERIADVTGLASPQVSDKYIVWIEKATLHYYDRSTGKEGQLHLGVAAYNPSLSGSVVVWEHSLDKAQVGFQIWGYDLVTGTDFPVVKGSHKLGPRISDRWVVYRDHDDLDDTSAGLYVTNLDTGEVIRLGRVLRSSYGTQVPPQYAIDAPWVVWSEGESGEKAALHLFNLDTRKADVVTIPSCALDNARLGHPENPVMSRTTILFTGCFQPMGYDMESNRFFSIPITQSQSQPAAFVGWAFADGQVAWVSLVGPKGQGQTQIYTAPVIRDAVP